MINQLQFRAWDLKNNKMVYFCGNNDADNLSRLESKNILHYDKNEFSIELNAGTSNRTYLFSEEFKLMLKTEFVDNNGKEVWMGDVVFYHDDEFKYGNTGNFYIDFWNGGFVLQFLENYGKPKAYPHAGLRDVQTTIDIFRVVGNIFENPNYLKEKSIPEIHA